ncbi:MAG: site-specific integrase [Bacteroidales bacterium]|nr:site-specific integrase [Bacteroidales bacterium]
MGRKKKSIVDKSPFKLRKRQLADGRVSLFLDRVCEGKHKYEFLQLYLVPETSEKAKRENARVLRKAEDIIKERTEALITQNAEQLSTDLSATTLSDFIRLLAENKRRSGKSGYSHLMTALDNLGKFRPEARLCDIDKRFCTDYGDWLLNTYKTRFGKPLAKYTAFDYFWKLGDIIHSAYKMGYISLNPWTQLDTSDKFQAPETDKRFLTPEEVQKLEATPMRNELIKRAFLFSCYCGLRISDVRRIRWGDIFENNGRWYMTITMKKTKNELSVPLTDNCLRWLPERGESEACIFDELPTGPSMGRSLMRWAKRAGIGDDIHFHVSRHTFGTLLMTAGIDLYTASKMMGHADVRATQVYAKIVDQKKQEAVSLLDNLF